MMIPANIFLKIRTDNGLIVLGLRSAESDGFIAVLLIVVVGMFVCLYFAQRIQTGPQLCRPDARVMIEMTAYRSDRFIQSSLISIDWTRTHELI